MSRTAEIRRDTQETQIRVRVDLDGSGTLDLQEIGDALKYVGLANAKSSLSLLFHCTAWCFTSILRCA